MRVLIKMTVCDDHYGFNKAGLPKECGVFVPSATAASRGTGMW